MRTLQGAGVQTSYLADSCNKCISTTLASGLSFLSGHLLPDDNWR